MMRLAGLFSDYAVLQRDQPIPVWGKGTPGETVTVRLASAVASVVVADDGSWLVRLPSRPAGGPFELVASAQSGEACIREVMIGEVWICSGQSNMEFTLRQTRQEADLPPAGIPALRVLTVAAPAMLGRQTACGGRWQCVEEASLAEFSAVAGWFGRVIHARLGVPVGLICNALGGTRVQAWMSRAALLREPAGADEVRAYESYAFDPNVTGRSMTLADWDAHSRTLDVGNHGLAAGWADAAYDDRIWRCIPVPSRWQDHGVPGSGILWYRRSFDLPATWTGRDLELRLGAVDKHDDTYVNGERVGGLSWDDGVNTWCCPRVYRVPACLVASGRCVVAVRVRSHVYHGGLTGPSRELRIAPQGEPDAALSLAGDWRYTQEQNWGVRAPPIEQERFAPGSRHAPYTLFDTRIAPLAPYSIRGVIWYQGESNAREAGIYRRLLPGMIADWRDAFGQGDFAFLQVQLANFQSPTEEPRQSDWAELRDAQAAVAQADPHGGFVVAIDVGESDNIHPADKRTVGERLARLALAETYALDGIPAGPVFTSAAFESGGRVRCRFRWGHGLSTRDGGPPRHVAIAGPDRAFVWADSAIEGDSLVAWSQYVPRPMSVRYAWADNPNCANLIGSGGLPAAPFRTDSW